MNKEKSFICIPNHSILKKSIGVRSCERTKNLTLGFTLIELLVVIAIIGILASVVLASLNSARAKGADAAVKSTMNNMRAQAELWYDNNGFVYASGAANTATTNMCLDSTVTSARTAAMNAGGVTASTTLYTDPGGAGKLTCHATTTTWAMEAPLKGGGFYCVGSIGLGTTTAVSTLGNGETDCR